MHFSWLRTSRRTRWSFSLHTYALTLTHFMDSPVWLQSNASRPLGLELQGRDIDRGDQHSSSSEFARATTNGDPPPLTVPKIPLSGQHDFGDEDESLPVQRCVLPYIVCQCVCQRHSETREPTPLDYGRRDGFTQAVIMGGVFDLHTGVGVKYYPSNHTWKHQPSCDRLCDYPDATVISFIFTWCKTCKDTA